ncbi:hypothetical protein SAMN05192566_1130 [Methylophilus rhizosphaerae]|uniref:Mercuric transport protein MerT n=1 Tax=Methylophilus rhizosphaerae TaxID=492660 RepID=A0A1G9BF40_9PROT|nr:hypothetical protein [Methylophilus rhizosphaerae]SDK37770.1 hypothetical protein SAMN05192566_1130 [Methylophilus rhizosphaerae]
MAAEINHLQASKRVNLLSLFTSGSTLICCALPATLVAIGSVATLTSLISHFPQLIWISEHKPLVFGLAAIMLLLAGALQWRARLLPCPADAQLAALCMKTRRQSAWIYVLSVMLFLVGAFFAFVAPLFID